MRKTSATLMLHLCPEQSITFSADNCAIRIHDKQAGPLPIDTTIFLWGSREKLRDRAKELVEIAGELLLHADRRSAIGVPR